MSVCKSGIFVGIDRYEFLSEDGQLRGGCVGAIKLREYFSKAAPDGTWDVLANNDTARVTRNDVLCKFREFIVQRPDAAVILFYFGGHGLVTDEGLVLAAEDYRPNAPFDTCVPLSRLMDIVATTGGTRRFLFMLDVCRTGNFVPGGIALLDNVSVCFACEQGMKTFEVGGNSVFIGRLFEVLQLTARPQDDGVYLVNWQSLGENLRGALASIGAQWGNLPEMINPPMRPTYLPAQTSHSSNVGDYLKRLPRVCLETIPLREDNIPEWQKKARHALKMWIGLEPPKNLTRLLKTDRGASMRIQLPSLSLHDDKAGLVEYILTECQNIFWKIEFTWPTPIVGSAWAKRLGDAHHLRTIPIGSIESMVMLQWETGKARGEIVSRSESSEGKVYIVAMSSGNHPWSLHRLGSKLFEVYKSICTLRMMDS